MNGSVRERVAKGFTFIPWGSSICIMKDWEISVPCLLPRVVPIKRLRSNTLPTKITKSNLKAAPLGDLNARWTAWRRSDYFYPEMIPEPDYSESDEESNEESHEDSDGERLTATDSENEEEEDRRRRAPARTGEPSSTKKSGTHFRSKYPQLSDEELIKPKKPTNPYMESSERRKLHKELKFSQKYGKTSGSQKTELQVAIEKYTESKIKKDLKASRKSSLEQILERQAQKIEKHEREGTTDTIPVWIDHLQRQHITSRTDPKTDEFYRVHAKVVGNLMNNDQSESEESTPSSSLSSPQRLTSSSESE